MVDEATDGQCNLLSIRCVQCIVRSADEQWPNYENGEPLSYMTIHTRTK